MAIRAAVPLFRCTDCGFVTTASEANALAAHEQGSPECDGEIELIADFTRAPAGAGATGRRRRRQSSGSGHDVRGVRARRDANSPPSGASPRPPAA